MSCLYGHKKTPGFYFGGAVQTLTIFASERQRLRKEHHKHEHEKAERVLHGTKLRQSSDLGNSFSIDIKIKHRYASKERYFMFRDIWQKLMLAPRAASPVHEDGVVILSGPDYAGFKKAEAFLDAGDQPVTLQEIFQDAAKLYGDFVITTVERHGQYSRRWNNAGLYPAVDLPHPEGIIKVKLTLPGKTQRQVERIKGLAGLNSDQDFWRHAVRFYSAAVIDEHNGWTLVKICPGGPDGGEPVFDVENSSQGDRVVQLSQYIRRDQGFGVAAALSPR